MFIKPHLEAGATHTRTHVGTRHIIKVYLLYKPFQKLRRLVLESGKKKMKTA